jgi:hypothetical protein
LDSEQSPAPSLAKMHPLWLLQEEAEDLKRNDETIAAVQSSQSSVTGVTGDGSSHAPISRILKLNRSDSGAESQSVFVRFENFKLQWGVSVKNLISKFVKFVVMPKGIQNIADVIKISVPGALEGTVAIFGIGKELGEHGNKPQYLKYQTPEDTWDSIVRGAMLGRTLGVNPTHQLDSTGRPTMMDPNTYFIFSQCENLNKQKSFGQALPKTKKLFVVYEEQSVSSRLDRIKGHGFAEVFGSCWR